MYKKLRKLGTKVQSGEVEYENVENMFKSWMGSFYMLLPKTKRKNMIHLYEELFHKKVAVVNKKLIITEGD